MPLETSVVIALLFAAFAWVYIKKRANAAPKPRVPELSEFPAGTEFMVKEFDVPLARLPGDGDDDGNCVWVNWYGGRPRPFDVQRLKVGNNWPADSFESWAVLVKGSLK